MSAPGSVEAYLIAALGYDGQTAVYDISNHVVYLPNGAKLEAHSGLGEMKELGLSVES